MVKDCSIGNPEFFSDLLWRPARRSSYEVKALGHLPIRAYPAIIVVDQLERRHLKRGKITLYRGPTRVSLKPVQTINDLTALTYNNRLENSGIDSQLPQSLHAYTNVRGNLGLVRV